MFDCREEEIQSKLERLERSLEDAEHMSRMVDLEVAPPVVMPRPKLDGIICGPGTTDDRRQQRRAAPSAQLASNTDSQRDAENERLAAELKKVHNCCYDNASLWRFVPQKEETSHPPIA